jgi:hypothetical protein
MYGERVGIQVLQHNTNQIKTRERLSPKPADTAEVGALDCYIKAAAMLELISASEIKCHQPDFNSWRGPRHGSTDSRLLVTSDTKASNDRAQIYLREKHAAFLGPTHSTKDKIQRDRSSSKEQPTTPPGHATFGANGDQVHFKACRCPS